MQLSEYFPMWESLTDNQKNQLTAHAVFKHIKKGSIIHNGDTDCTGLLLVHSGQLRAYILSDEGREITVYRLLDMDMCLFSASCMMRSIQFPLTVEAEKDTELWFIPSEIYKEIMENSAPLANFTNEIMATRFSEVMWLMEQILWKSFDKRLADFLMKESAMECTTKLKITHEAIGNHMGNPREVVTRMLRHFQNEGLVKLHRGTIELIDTNKLETIRNT